MVARAGGGERRKAGAELQQGSTLGFRAPAVKSPLGPRPPAPLGAWAGLKLSERLCSSLCSPRATLLCLPAVLRVTLGRAQIPS